TLHTNDAASAVTRLADMGVEPYLLASSLLGVLAQRLVRRLCPACRVAAAPTPGEVMLLERLGLSATLPVWGAIGCDACGGSGYRGRTGIYELLLVDDALRRLIHDRAGEAALRDVGMRAGTRPLIADGGRWLADGTTSLAELLRVADDVASKRVQQLKLSREVVDRIDQRMHHVFQYFDEACRLLQVITPPVARH